jgi:hypothetical protein
MITIYLILMGSLFAEEFNCIIKGQLTHWLPTKISRNFEKNFDTDLWLKVKVDEKFQVINSELFRANYFDWKYSGFRNWNIEKSRDVELISKNGLNVFSQLQVTPPGKNESRPTLVLGQVSLNNLLSVWVRDTLDQDLLFKFLPHSPRLRQIHPFNYRLYPLVELKDKFLIIETSCRHGRD